MVFFPKTQQDVLPVNSVEDLPISPTLESESLLVIPTPNKTVSDKTDGFTSRIWKRMSSAAQRTKEGCLALPHSVKKAVELTGSVAKRSGKIAWQGLVCLDEFLDIHNVGGTKNPRDSIEKSRARLDKHDQDFSISLELLADLAVEHYLKNSENIKSKISEEIQAYPYQNLDDEESDGRFLDPVTMAKEGFFSVTANIVDWFMGLSKELIGQTIKANILHIAANLGDQAFDADHGFADQQRNPFGRLISVIGACLSDYEECLEKVMELPEEKREAAYREIFNKLTPDLLAKFFPKGAEDIQLFHHTLPCIKLIKSCVWEKINQELPNLLYCLYQETRPLDEKCKNWKEQFEAKTDGFQADPLVNLPSTLLHHFVRNNQAKSLDDQLPAIEKMLIEQGVGAQDAQEMSLQFVKYAKEFLLTEDPNLHKMGSFLERYVMERLLWNLSQFLPKEADVPLPLYIVKQWLNGDVLKMLRSGLEGVDLSAQEKAAATHELLAPFGLDQRESFPLPPTIKDKAWPEIEKFLSSQLPDVILKAIPHWMALEKREKNQKKMNDSLDDSSLTSAVSYMTGTLTDKLFQAAHTQFVLSQKLNELCPSMKAEQIEAISEQWNALFEENDSLKLLKSFGQQCSEALVLQICKDLYENYQENCALNRVQPLFEEEDEGSLPSSFPAWLLVEITKACELLAIEGIAQSELEALQRAIQLNKALHYSKDSAQAQKDRAELDALWPILQPKFDHLAQHLLGILDYKKASALPCPEKMQPAIWKILNEQLPHILFEQVGDLMLPLLEKERLQEQMKTLPEGDVIRQGCQLLARDIVKHLPDWLDGAATTLPEKVIAEHSELKLTHRAQNYLTDVLNDILKTKDSSYAPMWQWVESYLDGVFLKVATGLGQMGEKDFQKIHTLFEQTKDELMALQKQDAVEISDQNSVSRGSKPKNEQDILVGFTDQLFDWLGLEDPQHLFGIPQALQAPVLKGVKAKAAQGLLGIYHVDEKIRQHVVKANPVEEHLPVSKVSQAAFAVTRCALDEITDQLVERVDDRLEVVSKISAPLNVWLDKQAEKDYAAAPLFKEVMKREVLNPWLGNLFELLDGQSSQHYKQELVNWLNPVLTSQIISRLAPLLEKESQGDFDQSLIMAILPVLTRHLKHLNQASQLPGGLNFEKFVDVAGHELHSGVPLTRGSQKSEDLAGEKKFYKEQVDLIFKWVFPNGKEDLTKILPDLELSNEQFDLLSASTKDVIVDQIPKAIETLFERDVLVAMFNDFIEDILEDLEEPIHLKTEKAVSLTKEEQERQREMDEQIGCLMIEAAKFLNFPVASLEKFPDWIKRAMGINSLQKVAAESIGAAVRKDLNGKLFSKSLQRVLKKSVKKKYIKKSREEKLEMPRKAEEHLKDLEIQLAQKILQRVFLDLSTRFENATDIFTNPVLKSFRAAFLTICSFFFVNVLGATLRFFKIERFVINRLHDILQHSNERLLNVLSQQHEMHKDLIYHGVEAFEEILTD